jgi:hypothetical protein
LKLLGFKDAVVRGIARKRKFDDDEKGRMIDKMKEQEEREERGEKEEKEESAEYKTGDRIYATFHSNTITTVYLGTIVSENNPTSALENRTYVVAYDDGDLWDAVPHSCVLQTSKVSPGVPSDDLDMTVSINSHVDVGDVGSGAGSDWRNETEAVAPPDKKALDGKDVKKGLRVVARWTAGTTLYSGVVRGVNFRKKTAAIDYDDGDKWDHCPFHSIYSPDEHDQTQVKMCEDCCVVIYKDGGCDSVSCRCGGRLDWGGRNRICRKVMEKAVRSWENGKLEEEFGVTVDVKEVEDYEETLGLRHGWD